MTDTKRIPVLADTKIKVGTAAAALVVLVTQAVMFERRITTLTDTAAMSDHRLEKIESAVEKTSTDISTIVVAVGKLDARESGSERLLMAEIERLKERVLKLESQK